jgi:hypothetical protein
MATTDQRAGFRLPWSSDQRPQANETATEAADGSDSATRDHTETAGPGSADRPSTETHPMSADAPIDAAGALGAKRPTKFLADLTRAMQAAAEEARTQALTQLQADAKSFIEEIHARSASDATDLRKEADDDVSGIRDWSKAEIARIREETEVRITDRKAELESQLERHAGVIEREIDRIQGQVTAFEGEMAYFFEQLLVEEDPTKFAVMAENLPEPPRFQARAMDFRSLSAQASSSAPVAEPPARPEPVVRPSQDTDTATTTDAAASVQVDDAAAPADADAAETDRSSFVAMGPAFESAAQADAETQKARTVAEPAVETGAPDQDSYTDPWGDTRIPERGKAVPEADALTAEASTAGGPTAEALSDDAPTGAELSGFDAAEAEAAAAVGADEEIPTMSDDALAARLAGLVPDRGSGEQRAAKSAGSTTTQVVVVGLVSVASIASFKRHLGRIPGVQSVGVSSGPDGEFVFAVNHADDVSLKDVVPTVPGFQARVTQDGNGVVNVTAHDPESDG